MRSAPTYQATQQLRTIDKGMCAAIMCTYNVSLSNDNWIQASLSIRLGDIGGRRVEDVALSAYISSMSATQGLVCQISSRTHDGISTPLLAALHTFAERQCPDVDFNALNYTARMSSWSATIRYTVAACLRQPSLIAEPG